MVEEKKKIKIVKNVKNWDRTKATYNKVKWVKKWCGLVFEMNFFFFTFLFPIWDELHKKYAIPLKYKHKHIYLKHCNKSTTYKNMSC